MSDSIAPNPYAAPTSQLQETGKNDGQALSIEEALSRGYDFNIGDLIGEAWQRTKGTKGIIIGGFIAFYAVLLVVSFVLGGILGLVGLAGGESFSVVGMVTEIVIGILASALAYPFMAGINMVGIRRAADQPISFN